MHSLTLSFSFLLALLFQCSQYLPSEDLGDAAVGDLQDPADVAGPCAGVRQLHDLLPRAVGQRPASYKHPAELVNTAVTCRTITLLTPINHVSVHI